MTRAAALVLSIGLTVTGVQAQSSQGTSPLTGAKGGTNNGFMQFAGPATTMKTFTLPNASGTIAVLDQIQTWTGAQSFADGKLILLGASSGSTTLKASAAASGTLTLPAATDTLVGRATTDTLTNKTFDTAGTGNSFLIAGVAATANTGTGAVVRASSPTLVTPALGTPSALVLTNANGLPISGLSGLASGIASWLATPSSANLAAALTDETGTGAAVFANSPTLVTPNLGTPSAAVLTNATALPVGGMAAIGANTMVANATGGSASPTAVSVPSCSGANQAINWTAGTGPGCVTISGGGGGGVWSNTRLAKTAAYTTVTGDCSDTLALGGTAFFAVTFNAPSGYASTCAFLVLNEDSTRGKMILPQFATSSTSIAIGTGSKAFTTSAGLSISITQRYRVYSLANTANWMAGLATYSGTTFTLTVDTVGGSGTFTDWQIAPEVQMPPSTSRWIYAQNNVWKLSDQQRWLTPGRGNIYELCVVGGGSNSNDGFGSGSTSDCLASIQEAVHRIGMSWDGGGYNACSVGIYAGAYGTVSQTGSAVGCYLTFNVRGTMSMTGTGACFANGDGSISVWNWNLGFVPTFKCNTANSAGTGAFYCHQTCIYDFNGGTAIWIPGGVEGLGTGGTKGTNDVFFYVDLQGSASYNAQVNVGNGTDTFNPLAFVFAEGHASQITLSGTIAFNPFVTMNKALVLQVGSLITHTASWPGASVTNATTVKGGAILVQSSTVPGPAATATSPGVICTSKAC
ncbi:hypothetical protein HL667_00085 [Bradyrhizobium sp. 83012]|uniref:Uncharacterized protein n=1 Tax=Bradyrhizobium aeschynomenes TaxID=2734909 RepID=A0ABX2C509_9BRAD|nr:hypothetical protein [Bradyrhizobium aeschynomenes]NPU63393.1 hypothetical protein [Bradyrhizobium aeschynomenes]